MRARFPFAVIVFALISCGTSMARAQQPGTVYQGGVSQNDTVPPGTVYQGSASENDYSPLDPRNFPQEDPRQVQPELMPAALQGNQSRCIPPDPTWTLLVEYQNQCLYAAPLSNVKKWLYGNNVVIPISQMLQLGAQAGRCGADPWDPSKAVCTGGAPSAPADGGGVAQEEPQTDNPPGYALPLPPNVRRALLIAAAQMDAMATGAQGYSLAATNRFFRCLQEAVDGDLRFLAQPGYVPAAQLAKSLHEGVWSYLTSNPYRNNLGMYDGAVAAMKRAMQDPACSFAQTANAAAIAAATGGPKSAMAEASEGMSAARAALNAAKAAEAIEQDAHSFGRAPWYVPGLRCPGCLVYGTAEGGYADFANSVGGRTINSIPKPENLSWQRFSQQVLDGAAANDTPVLFSLVGMEDLEGALSGTGKWANKVTSSELRYIRQNWSKFQNMVRFYDQGSEVPPPWQSLPGYAQ